MLGKKKNKEKAPQAKPPSFHIPRIGIYFIFIWNTVELQYWMSHQHFSIYSWEIPNLKHLIQEHKYDIALWDI